MTEYHYIALLAISIYGAFWGTQKKIFRLSLLLLVLSPLSFYISFFCIGDVMIRLQGLGTFFMICALFFIGLAVLLFIKYYLFDKKLSH